MFESFRRPPKTTRAVIPSYTAALKAAERWTHDNHRYTPVDRDGTPWEIKLQISLIPRENPAILASTMPKRSPPSSSDWQVRLKAQTTITCNHLIQIGALDPQRDERLINLGSSLEFPIQLKEKLFRASHEAQAKDFYFLELPLYISQIEKTSAKDIKKNLFCQYLEHQRTFGISYLPESWRDASATNQQPNHQHYKDEQD